MYWHIQLSSLILLFCIALKESIMQWMICWLYLDNYTAANQINKDMYMKYINIIIYTMIQKFGVWFLRNDNFIQGTKGCLH